MKSSKGINPIIHHGGKTTSLNDFINAIDQMQELQDSFNPLLIDFEKYLIEELEFTNEGAKRSRTKCVDFIYYVIEKTNCTKLTELTRVEVCSKYRKYLNRGNTDKNRFGQTVQLNDLDDRPTLKLFFLFLHQNKNISNPDALKGLCTKDEFKKLGLNTIM